MVTSVLDASALIALIRNEPGFSLVAGAVRAGAAVSTVNLCEVLTKSSDHGADVALLDAQLASYRLSIEPFEPADAREAARMRAGTRHLGLSLGDRACLALGRRLGVPILTADRPWAKLDPSFRVTVIR